MDKKLAKEYACPMRCEGDKVYQKKGDCPKCNMQLIQVNKNGKNTEYQNIDVQSGHDHKAEKKKTSI